MKYMMKRLYDVWKIKMQWTGVSFSSKDNKILKIGSFYAFIIIWYSCYA